ncbi:hypothetical protein EOB36_03490 [Mesorhizobium sp. M6A.T.Cr.TU.017.01.1.1]|uniref:hypothetical protein n=1 Tax=unclassified Mesorhizobium TaxID=325217 RepID=UPI000FD1BF94|nr:MULTISPECIES: hypothetical protein [unclassified Mesorhizobium]RUV04327.1 hypothetical protein EOB36_03490 [Mesorhizobium sp. M6A.T.Cr.TU.017.01.1.1]RWP48211.1 MAG: hypothetical protein EOR05_15030 [Mesorhizobium sp.]
MVSQPAYLTNLKKYAKLRFRGDEDEDARIAVRDLDNESDRGAIILAATNVEDMLELKILERLPTLQADEPARKFVFEQDGPISTFSRKILMAYAMGIVDKPYRKLIDLVREIRNACAHSRQPISLQVPELQDACKVVISDIWPDIKDHNPKTIRMAFVMKCTFIQHYILHGEKLEGRDAHLAHWEKLKRGEA